MSGASDKESLNSPAQIDFEPSRFAARAHSKVQRVVRRVCYLRERTKFIRPIEGASTSGMVPPGRPRPRPRPLPSCEFTIP